MLIPPAFDLMVASVISKPQIDIGEMAYYEVNKQGDLTIQILGTIKGVAVSDCDFRLTIPESFEIPIQADGSPVLEMLNSGAPLAIAPKDDKFQFEFVIMISNSTGLPYTYDLEINTTNTRLNKTITPKWPNQAPHGGGGAGISWEEYPEITSFYAKDTTKGSKGQVTTYIFNPHPFFEFYLYGLKYRIMADDYNDWHEWTQEYSEGTPIYAQETEVVIDYINCIFTSSSGGEKYALNAGDNYNVTSVYARGGAWTDEYVPDEDEGKFEVNPTSTTKIFSVVLYDSLFEDLTWLSSVSGFFYDSVSHKVKVNYSGNIYSYSDGFEQLKGIDYVATFLTWNPGDLNTEDMLDDLPEHAGDALGLSGDWNGAGNWGTLTSKYNHGFDQVIGLSGNGPPDIMGGRANQPGNKLVLQGRNWGTKKKTELFLVHELSHNLGASHDVPHGYIMKGGEDNPEYANGWFVYWYLSKNRMTNYFRG